MSGSFEFRLNGELTRVEAVRPQATLLEFVRSRGFTAAKEGCAEGECGACAVILVAANGSGSVYRSVNSCLIPLPSAAGQEIYTVESFAADGTLSEVQKVMVEHAGSQCGYCTPGFIASMFAEQYRPDRRGPCDVHALSGNLCRCTGYRPIADACRSVGFPSDGHFSDRLKETAPDLRPVEYETADGKFSRPETLAECIHLLRSDPAARLVAGNTDLGVATNLQSARFPHLISVDAVPELHVWKEGENWLEIGAAVSLTELGERWANPPGVINEWLPLFASPLIRNRATFGGNLATASPIGDSAPLLLALGAEVRVAGSSGERTLPVEFFFAGYRRTMLAADEVIVSVRLPKPFPSYARFFKVARRRTDDISTVAACFALGQTGVIRMGFGGVAATPVLLTATDPNTVPDLLARTLKPVSDHRGSAAWRLALTQSLFEKFWYERSRVAA